MRLKGDKTFMGLLNNIRVSDCPKNNIKQFRLRKIDLNSVRLGGIEIFADIFEIYTACKLNQSNNFEIKVEAIDLFPGIMTIHLRTLLSARSCSATAGLALSLRLEKGVRVMITSNIDLSDWLINGQFGMVFDFGYLCSSITKVYLKLDD